jgi:hypothetical protein
VSGSGASAAGSSRTISWSDRSRMLRAAATQGAWSRGSRLEAGILPEGHRCINIRADYSCVGP